MVLIEGLWSKPQSGTLALVMLAFGLGLGVGSMTTAPVSTGGSAEPPAIPVVPVTVTQIKPPDPVRTAHPAEVLRVLDGDTFEARVHLWPGLDITTRVRLRGIDAPEFKARCVEERIKAEASRNALKAILDQGEVGIMRVRLDKYRGRVIADASTRASVDVAAALLSAGHVRRYAGARREGWCS
jgi:endonuclease YncB( thermonuclease family)